MRLNRECIILDYRGWILDCETGINSQNQCSKPNQEFWRGYNAIRVKSILSIRHVASVSIASSSQYLGTL